MPQQGESPSSSPAGISAIGGRLGGWVTEQMEKIPVAGESFEYNNLRIVVTRSTPKRVAEVQITVGEAEDE